MDLSEEYLTDFRLIAFAFRQSIGTILEYRPQSFPESLLPQRVPYLSISQEIVDQVGRSKHAIRYLKVVSDLECHKLKTCHHHPALMVMLAQ
jgi:hypothetical protein